jgi:hypothetical protein
MRFADGEWQIACLPSIGMTDVTPCHTGLLVRPSSELSASSSVEHIWNRLHPVLAQDTRNARRDSVAILETPIGKPVVDRHALVARARALQPLHREHAAEGDAQRSLTEKVNTALTEAGMFPLAAPTRFGGYGTDMRTLATMSSRLAGGAEIADAEAVLSEGAAFGAKITAGISP